MSTEIGDRLPPAFAVASTASERGQATYKWLTAVALVLLAIAAAGGLVAEAWAGWLSAAAFVASLVLTVHVRYRTAERDWYDGRALAESAKSLGFKYAVCGEPFELDDPNADRGYRESVAALIAELRRLGSSVSVPEPMPDPEALRAIRARPRSERAAIYRAERLDDQHGWYARRAREHRASARLWRGVVIVSQVAGAMGAVLKGLGIVDVDLLALFATVATAATAWLAAGDYVDTARAYDFAALELDQALGGLADAQRDEASWARFVADSEQAMSREHTMWLARRRTD